MLADQPRPEIARSAVILGEVHVGAGTILAQGLVARSHGAAVSIGSYSAILENGVVIGTSEHRQARRHLARPAADAGLGPAGRRGRYSSQGATMIAPAVRGTGPRARQRGY